MTDGKPQPCRNACGQQVYVSDRSGKWLPYNVIGDQKHDCPNYKKKISEFKKVAEKVEGEITSNPSVFGKTNTLGKVAELETQNAHEHIEINKKIARLEQAVQALVGELSFKKGNEVVDKTTTEK